MRTHYICAILLGLGIVALLPTAMQGQTIIVCYVDGDLTGGDGQSWNTAHGSLQAALAAANPGANETYQLWVKPGRVGSAHLFLGIQSDDTMSDTTSIRSAPN